MPDPSNFTNPLSGREIVNDILGQIRTRLATDCNLRASDGYSGGYSGKVHIKLSLNAVRTTPVEMEIPISTSIELNAPAPDSFPSEDLIAMEINEEISIPVEPNLNAVRERIEENKEIPSAEHETPASESAPEPHARRKYTRRSALVSAVAE